MPEPMSFEESLAAAQQEQAESDRLKTSMNLAMMASPDENARVIKTANALGVDQDAVRGDLSAFEKMVQESKFNAAEFSKKYPISSKFFSNPDNAAVGWDNYQGIASIEEAHARLIQQENQRTGRSWVSGLGAALGEGGLRLAALTADVFDSVAAMAYKDKAKRARIFGSFELILALSRKAKTGADWLGSKKRATENVIITDPTTGEQKINWGAVNPMRGAGLENIANIAASEAIPMAVTYALALSTAPETGGVSIETATALNAGKFAKLAKLGRSVAQYAKSPIGWLNSGRVVQGQWDEGIKDLMAKNPGMTLEEAKTKAAPGALLAGALSPAFGGVMEARIMEDAAHALSKAPGGYGIANKILTRIKSFAVVGAKEAAQEAIEGIGEDLSAWLTYQPDKTFKEAAGNMLTNAVGGFVIGGTMGAAIHGSRSIEEAQNQEFFKAIADGSPELRKRMPDALARAVAEIVKGSPVENLKMPVDAFETFYQSKGIDPEEKAAELGIRNYAEAKLAGSDLEIPTANYATYVEGTPDHAELSKDIRFFQDQLTPREAANAEKKREQIKEMASEVDAETVASAEFQAIKDEIKNRYMQAGEIANVAETYALDMAKVYSRMAERAGIKMGELFAQYSPKVVRGEAPQIADIIREAFTEDNFPEDGVSWQEGEDIFFQAAYHGSPYRFDKFSLEHIGKGEGAQAYGWGLYFAGNREVANYYRETLGANQYYYDGKMLNDGSPIATAAEILYAAQGDIEMARDDVGAMGLMPSTKRKVLSELGKLDYTKIKQGGQLYQVDIPDEGSYLLWDKPLSEQPEAVKKALKSSGMVKEYFIEDSDTGQDIYSNLVKAEEYKNGRKNAAEDASAALKNIGIAGIKYLDGSSRDQGEGSYNYVIFDDNAVKITKTFYQSMNIQGSGDYARYRERIGVQFGSKEWQDQYKDKLGKNARAKGDRQIRAGKAMKAAASAQGQAEFDYERNQQAMRDAEDFARFERAMDRVVKPRGWFTANPDGSFTIGKTPEGDFSTFIHEPAHAYLEMFRDLASKEGASEGLKEDWQKVLAFLGNDGGEITVEQHEKWARANELYAREGKAPSTELRGVFERFKIWLEQVYRKISELDVELSDDIRGVFDRMRATDDEIAIAHQQINGPQLFNSAEEAGWTEKQFKNYAIAKNIEIAQAREEILAKINEAALREQTAEWKEEQKLVRQAVADVIDSSPEYVAIAALRRGKLEDGTPISINKGELVKQFGEERTLALHKKHRNIYRENGVMDAQAAAEILGFESGEAMVSALEDVGKREDLISSETRRIMTERHGDIRYDGTIGDQARIALVNEEKAQSLHKELKALKKKVEAQASNDQERKNLAKLALEIPPLKTFRDAAIEIINDRAIIDLDTNRYLNGMRKYSRLAYKEATSGNFEKALGAKQKELLNHYLFLEGTKTKAEAQKYVSFAKSLEKPKAQQKLGQAQGTYLEQVNNILDRFNFKEETNRAINERRQSLAEFMLTLPEGSETIFDTSLLDEKYKKNYREMSITELRNINDALKNIQALARADYEFINDGKAVSFKTAVAEMVETARKNNKSKPLPVDPNAMTWLEKARDGLQFMDSSIKKLEWLVDHLDGGDINGAWRKYIFTPIANAQYLERDLNNKVSEILIKAIEELPKDQRLSWLDTYKIDGIGNVTKKYIISVALNMGNKSNMEKMIKGMGWAGNVLDGSPQIDSMLSKLTKAEWDFVQKIWDGIGVLWPDIAALEKRTVGVEPPKVEASPFTVQTKDGETITLAGGYYPVAYDGKRSTQGAKQEAGPVERLFENAYIRATTPKGHTKTREEAFSAPLILDFEQVVTRHITGVVKDISHREAAMAINKLLMNQEIRDVVQQTMGPAYEAMMLPWLRGAVNDTNGGVDGLNRWDKAAMTLRSNVVIAALGLRLSTIALQATDWVRAMDRVSPRFLGAAILKFATNPREMINTVRSMSKEMAGRADNLDRDLRKQWKALSGQGGVKASIQKFAMMGLSMADVVTSVTTWWGAYQQALHSNPSHEQAAAEADRSVRLTLMSGAPKDQTAIQRKKDIGWKFATMFMGDASAIYGILGDVQHKLAKGENVTRQAARLLFSVMLPAVLAEYIKARGPKDDEDELWWATKKGLLAFPGSIPVLRDVVQAMDSGRDYQFTPIAGAMTKIGKAGVADWYLLKGDDDQTFEDAFLHSADAAAVIFGLPLSQPLTTYKYIRKVESGQENPDSSLELIKNMALGAPPAKGGK